MSFSLIYICCSFQGGILSVVFPAVAICFWPAGNLECPCLFSDLILFPFLLLFFYIVPYHSFSFMSFSLIYICCSFRGGILSAFFFHSSTTPVYSPKGITYMIYTLIHGRDPIPWRITYIEYRSPVKIFIFFLGNTTKFHWFSLQNSFFHSSTTPVVGGTLRWAWKNHFFNAI